MTPQVARIDAHALRRDVPNRLFYTGTVLRARADGFGGSRSPQQFGAEIFGHAGPASDIEIIRLMLETLKLAGMSGEAVMLDLGHVGVYRGLVDDLGLDDQQERALFTALQRGSIPDAEALLESLPIDRQAAKHLLALMHLRGERSVIEAARKELGSASDDVHQALEALNTIVDALATEPYGVHVHIDLAELRGYRYHSGMLFATYTRKGEELARGGRYDAIGAAFGHARSATGFSGDLKQLADLGNEKRHSRLGVFVAGNLEADAWATICELRAAGERVVVGFG